MWVLSIFRGKHNDTCPLSLLAIRRSVASIITHVTFIYHNRQLLLYLLQYLNIFLTKMKQFFVALFLHGFAAAAISQQLASDGLFAMYSCSEKYSIL